MKSGQKRVPEDSDIERLHRRYQQQAGWTAALRSYLMSQIILPEQPIMLEVGCGTGVILSELQSDFSSSQCIGIDHDQDALQYGRKMLSPNHYAQADAANLPFSANSFDLIFCHFFLLWAKPLLPILAEIQRILKPGAHFLAFAEPDYGGRIDHPAALHRFAHWQEQALQRQGAHTRIGRELAQLFQQAGFAAITSGLMGGEWQVKPTSNQEQETLLKDLKSLPEIDQQELEHLLKIDQTAHEEGTRILYVPTFYAVGRKKPLAISSIQPYNSGR
ncbi:MAG: class I SAM-dependent methyltransferase [Anaerolineae bacterium]|jgi:ubiquinone/menaquinone biosynthesis C-methylase UbiE|nr:class I SAM-dependent methyltransferase [Anaerolineae bacterium]